MAQMTINGRAVPIPDEWADETLLSFLRHRVGLSGVRLGCGVGLCGACTVLLDGQAARACTITTAAAAALGRGVVTAEGLTGAGAAAVAVRRAWEEVGVAQCGYCQCGQMAQAAALLAQRPALSSTEIEAGMAQVMCRCGTQPRIRVALVRAADLLRAGG